MPQVRGRKKLRVAVFPDITRKRGTRATQVKKERSKGAKHMNSRIPLEIANIIVKIEFIRNFSKALGLC
jgi:hypothetical protein